MDSKTLFSLLHAIQQQPDTIESLCNNNKLTDLFTPNPLSFALRLTPLNKELIQRLAQLGFQPSANDIDIYEALPASDPKAALSKIFSTPLPRRGFFSWRKKTVLSRSEFTQLWHHACQKGQVQLSQYLLALYTPSTSQFSEGLEQAKQANHPELITSLVSHPRFTIPKQRHLLDFAVEKNHPTLVKALLHHKQKFEPQGFFNLLSHPFTTLWTRLRYGNPAKSIKNALRTAVREQKVDIVKALLQEPHFTLNKHERTELLNALFEPETADLLPRANDGLVQTLLEDPRISAGLPQLPLEKKANLLVASKNNTLIQTFLSLREIEASKDSLPTYAGLFSLKYGHFEIARWLLNYPEQVLKLERAFLDLPLETHHKHITFTFFQRLLTLDRSSLTEPMIKEILYWAITQDNALLLSQALDYYPSTHINDLISQSILKKAPAALKALIESPMGSSIDFHQALHLAATKKNLPLIMLLAGDDRAIPQVKKNSPDLLFAVFSWVAKEGYLDVAKHILQQTPLPKSFDPSTFWDVPVEHYYVNKDWSQSIRRLLQRKSSIIKSLEPEIHLVLLAATFGYKNILETLLKEKHEPLLVNLAFCCALKNGHLEIARTLLNDPSFDPTIHHHEPLSLAAANGHHDIVKALLAMRKVNPAAKNNDALRLAAQNNHPEIVETLLQEKRVNPLIDNSFILFWAAEKGHSQVINKLLQDKRVNPSVNNNYAFRLAAENGHLALVKHLLQDKRINPADQLDQAFRLAAQKGHLQIITELLQDERINPANCNNAALRLAAEHGHLPIVKTLLKHPKVLATINKHDTEKLVHIAVTTENVKLLKILLQFSHPKLPMDPESFFLLATNVTNPALVKLFCAFIPEETLLSLTQKQTHPLLSTENHFLNQLEWLRRLVAPKSASSQKEALHTFKSNTFIGIDLKHLVALSDILYSGKTPEEQAQSLTSIVHSYSFPLLEKNFIEAVKTLAPLVMAAGPAPDNNDPNLNLNWAELIAPRLVPLIPKPLAVQLFQTLYDYLCLSQKNPASKGHNVDQGLENLTRNFINKNVLPALNELTSKLSQSKIAFDQDYWVKKIQKHKKTTEISL